MGWAGLSRLRATMRPRAARELIREVPLPAKEAACHKRGLRERAGAIRDPSPLLMPSRPTYPEFSSALRFTCKVGEKERGPDKTRTRGLCHAKAGAWVYSCSLTFKNTCKQRD